jgi:hypothetical protein
MTTRTLCAALAGLGAGALLWASPARADEFGDKGQLIFSADRLMPLLSFTQDKLTDNNVNPSQTTTVSSSQISLLWGSTSVSGDANSFLANGGISNVYTVPRIGFDYVVIPHLTVGGNIVVFTTIWSGTNTCNGTNCQSSGNGSSDVLGIAPRVGYVLNLSSVLSIWLRGGMSYYHEHVAQPTQVAFCNNRSDSNNASLEVGGLDIDPQLVISPINHFAFIAGPTIDIGFAGSASTDSPSMTNCNARDTSSDGFAALNIGLTGGLVGWF